MVCSRAGHARLSTPCSAGTSRRWSGHRARPSSRASRHSRSPRGFYCIVSGENVHSRCCSVRSPRCDSSSHVASGFDVTARYRERRGSGLDLASNLPVPVQSSMAARAPIASNARRHAEGPISTRGTNECARTSKVARARHQQPDPEIQQVAMKRTAMVAHGASLGQLLAGYGKSR